MKLKNLFLPESINDSGIFKAIFIVGLPGSGKSYTAKRLMGTIRPVIVNTDRAAEYIGKKKDIFISKFTWDVLEDDALRITEATLFGYLNGMLPLFIDGTSNSASRIMHRMGILESLGYDIGIIHVKTSLETAIERSKERTFKVGRDVDEDFIKHVHAESEDNINFLRSRVEFFKDVNNEYGELTDVAMLKLFKASQSFFSKEIANPIGQRSVAALKEAKQKYLSPALIEDKQLKNLIRGWYK